MLLAAGGAPGQVGAHPGDQRVGVPPGQLGLDVAVELVEAGVAAELRDTRAEERRKQGGRVAARASGPHGDAETAELLGAIGDAIREDLTVHQREVLLALAVDGVPIDVLAERRATTRGALYKTLHDARRRLRAGLAERGLAPPGGLS